MPCEDMLARLLAQAGTEGADLVTLHAVVEEASERGAARALHRLGLEDSGARSDLSELRELLGAWRDAKRGLWRALLGWVTRALLALLLVGLALRLGHPEWLR
ncbi:DUF6127 family protein [Novosphingobium sp.]|uniref:DUF6127 family protein n=1 Tax=Novosphingobium sp. TaxID=1874826 RepID=UPI0026197514|nr:DUF6127 family protein [Novosphingobium sp.]